MKYKAQSLRSLPVKRTEDELKFLVPEVGELVSPKPLAMDRVREFKSRIFNEVKSDFWGKWLGEIYR